MIILLLLLHASLLSNAQSEKPPAPNTQNTRNDLLDPDKQIADVSNRRIINRHDTLYFFYSVEPRRPIRTAPRKWYYWYGHDTVLATEGAYGGRVLDGEYKVLYPHGGLRESGSFSMGLKTDVWRTWFPNGTLQSITHWKRGLKNGLFESYNANGEIVSNEEYKHDKKTSARKDSAQ
jgi:hypothetical protein